MSYSLKSVKWRIVAAWRMMTMPNPAYLFRSKMDDGRFMIDAGFAGTWTADDARQGGAFIGDMIEETIEQQEAREASEAVRDLLARV